MINLVNTVVLVGRTKPTRKKKKGEINQKVERGKGRNGLERVRYKLLPSSGKA